MPITGLLRVECTRSDGATVTASITYAPATGALTGATIVNTAAGPVNMLVTRQSDGVVQPVNAPPGTTALTPQQLGAVGLTNVAQVRNLSVECV